LNFSIEEIWKEMEEINKARQNTQQEFKEFQDTFFDRKELNGEINVDSPFPEQSTITPRRKNSIESM
jgi:hypothetical protein